MSSSLTISVSMDMSSTTASAPAASTSTSGGHGHGGMDMGESGDGPACKISMLWNWYTIDACFLSDQWHINSEGTFAVTCIGVVLLVVCLEFLRRLGKEYDSAILQQFQQNAAAKLVVRNPDVKVPAGGNSKSQDPSQTPCSPGPTYLRFRPTPMQQIIRAIIHMATFGVAYIIMLLAMYFNGYIIIMIFLGALIGKFVCDWGSQRVAAGGFMGAPQAQGEQELTYCCG